MADQATARETIEDYLLAQENKDLLRFITCGSVDDGKSTLIGRLLYDSKLIFEDQLAALEADSRTAGTVDGDIDFALLVDGLEAEREQGITIDVAYRFFATDKRKFIVADTPGHEQYTRNMATGASTAELAVILVDARKGVLPQTRRHSIICSLLGVRQVILAVNKMDLVDYAEDVFTGIEREYRELAARLGYETVQCIPISALKGDNTLTRSDAMPWYDGPVLMSELEDASLARDDASRPFRFPVQWVNRPDQNFRGFSGTITSGTIAVGDEIVALPSGRTSTVERIVTYDGDISDAGKHEAVTLALADEIDVSRGDVICKAADRADTSDQFEAKIIWMGEEPMMPGRPYIVKSAAKTATMVVTRLKYGLNVNTLEHQASKHLDLNDLGVCNISLDQRIAFDPYEVNRQTGSFIIIDRMTNNTVGAGMIDFGLRRATNIHWQATTVDQDARAAMKGQKPRALWFTGLSGSGKSTIANALERRLLLAGKHTYMLDGDNVRHGLNKDLGFTEEDRVENIRRVGEVAKLMVDAGLVVLISFISPFRSERRMARELFGAGEFIEVFVDTPLEVCEQRDPKGLYKKARAGEIKNFTGYDSPYEAPEKPELRLDTTELSPDDCAELILDFLENGD